MCNKFNISVIIYHLLLSFSFTTFSFFTYSFSTSSNSPFSSDYLFTNLSSIFFKCPVSTPVPLIPLALFSNSHSQPPSPATSPYPSSTFSQCPPFSYYSFPPSSPTYFLHLLLFSLLHLYHCHFLLIYFVSLSPSLLTHYLRICLTLLQRQTLSTSKPLPKQ